LWRRSACRLETVWMKMQIYERERNEETIIDCDVDGGVHVRLYPYD
jgi:hypothetical protein